MLLFVSMRGAAPVLKERRAGAFRSRLRRLLTRADYAESAGKFVEARSLSAAVLQMHKEVADVTQAVAMAMEDGRVSQTEKALIKREISEAMAAMEVLRESVKVA